MGDRDKMTETKEASLEELGILKDGISIKDIKKIQSKGELDSWKSFIENHFDNLERNIDLIKDSFRNQIVVDLGAGITDLGYKLATLADAKAYVGVESHNANYLRAALHTCSKLKNIRGKKPIPYSALDLDMLSFLRCVKDDSISMIGAGIDDFVIHDGEYGGPLNDEIERTLSPTGGFLSIKSELYFPSKDKRIMISGEYNDYVGDIVAILKK